MTDIPGADAAPLLLVTAAAVEARPALTAELTATTPGTVSHLPARFGNTLLLVAGVGRAGDAQLQRTLASHQPRAVINLGFAGALAPDLHPGAVVIGVRWQQQLELISPGASSEPLRTWLERLVVGAGRTARVGTMYTVDAPFHGAAQRDRLHAATGALSVDMETARWGELAAAAGADFVALRVISDRADLRLPRPRHQLLDAAGSIRWGRWLRCLSVAGAWRSLPGQLARLRQARDDWRRALASLDDVTAALLDALRNDAG